MPLSFLVSDIPITTVYFDIRLRCFSQWLGFQSLRYLKDSWIGCRTTSKVRKPVLVSMKRLFASLCATDPQIPNQPTQVDAGLVRTFCPFWLCSAFHFISPWLAKKKTLPSCPKNGLSGALTSPDTWFFALQCVFLCAKEQKHCAPTSGEKRGNETSICPTGHRLNEHRSLFSAISLTWDWQEIDKSIFEQGWK